MKAVIIRFTGLVGSWVKQGPSLWSRAGWGWTRAHGPGAQVLLFHLAHPRADLRG